MVFFMSLKIGDSALITIDDNMSSHPTEGIPWALHSNRSNVISNDAHHQN